MAAQSTICSVCYESASLKCACCRSIQYCDAVCQKSDWTDHKLICKQRSELSPRPSDNHFLALHFPTDEPKPRLIWVRGQPDGSSKLHLHEADVSQLIGRDFDCVEAGTEPGPIGSTIQASQPSPAGKHPLMPPLGLHYTTAPGYQRNACLGRWVGEQWLAHIAPGPLLVSGVKGQDEGDGHRDFEMRDLRTLKSVLTMEGTNAWMDFAVNRAGSTRMKKSWLRM